MGEKVSEGEKSLYPESSRRDFLKTATTVAAGLAMPKVPEAATPNRLPTVSLGAHRVSRLIVGSNPIYGYSHFNHQYDMHMLEWFTDERIVKLLSDCEEAGINTWQASFHPNMKRQFPKLRGTGCKIQFLCLAWPYDETTERRPMQSQTPEEVLAGTIRCAKAAAEFKPIGIAFHGHATDVLFRAGKIDIIKDYIDSVHALGIAAGISTHNPKILTTLDEKGMANDFYMAGLHYVTRHPEDWMKEIGTLPLDEGWIAADPPRMAEAIRKVSKPTLVYKVLGAGRKCNSEEQKRGAIAWAYNNIKPIDATIIGLYPRYSDQVTETVKMVREVMS